MPLNTGAPVKDGRGKGGSMKPSLLAAVAVLAGTAAFESQPISNLLADVYPNDTAKRQALNLCMLADPKFDRLDGAARDACYQHAFAPAASMAMSTPVVSPPPNQVDLRQAAGRGVAPANDVRIVQQTDGSQH
jgi:hypothetical protein